MCAMVAQWLVPWTLTRAVRVRTFGQGKSHIRYALNNI